MSSIIGGLRNWFNERFKSQENDGIEKIKLDFDPTELKTNAEMEEMAHFNALKFMADSFIPAMINVDDNEKEKKDSAPGKGKVATTDLPVKMIGPKHSPYRNPNFDKDDDGFISGTLKYDEKTNVPKSLNVKYSGYTNNIPQSLIPGFGEHHESGFLTFKDTEKTQEYAWNGRWYDASFVVNKETGIISCMEEHRPVDYTGVTGF